MSSFLEVHPPLRGQACDRSPARLFRVAAITAMAAALSACGGGGGGSAPAPPPAPSPSGPLDAVMSVPDPVGYDADKLAAFNRLNEIRLSAGLGMLAQNRLMDQAAQAHADWEIANNVYDHVERAGTAGFAGMEWWDRDEALGYTPLEGSEVLSSGYAAATAVDVLVNVAYHRIGILTMENVDVGIGRSSQTVPNVADPVVIDFAVPEGDAIRGRGQRPQNAIDGVAIWPRDGAQGVWMRMGGEVPNPAPDLDVRQLGTPVSLTVANSHAIDAASFVVTNSATGSPVQALLLNHMNDPNSLVPASYVALIPTAPLSPNTTYTIAFSGTLTDLSTGATAMLARNWEFTTGDQ
jgi:hypothetical protein